MIDSYSSDGVDTLFDSFLIPSETTLSLPPEYFSVFQRSTEQSLWSLTWASTRPRNCSVGTSTTTTRFRSPPMSPIHHLPLWEGGPTHLFSFSNLKPQPRPSPLPPLPPLSDTPTCQPQHPFVDSMLRPSLRGGLLPSPCTCAFPQRPQQSTTRHLRPLPQYDVSLD